MNRQELYEELKDINEIAIAIDNISEKEYNTVIKPVVNWIKKLKTMGGLEFRIMIYKERGFGDLILVPIADNIDHLRLVIPPEIKNIKLDDQITYINNVEIVYKSSNQFVVNDNTYYVLSHLMCNGFMRPDIKLIKAVERISLQKVKVLQHIKTMQEVQRKLQIISLEDIYNIIELHRNCICEIQGKRLDINKQAELNDLKQELKFIITQSNIVLPNNIMYNYMYTYQQATSKLESELEQLIKS